MAVYDFESLDYDTVEQGDYLPDGWYRCRVEDVSEDTKFGTGNYKFTFRVTHGKLKGHKQVETLYHPDNAEDVEKSKHSAKRCGIFAKRLGLWKPGDVRPQIDWTRAIGMDVIIQVAGRKYTDSKGNAKESHNVTFAGIYGDLTHEGIPAEMRVVPPAGSQSPPAGPTQQRLPIGDEHIPPPRQRRPNYDDL